MGKQSPEQVRQTFWGQRLNLDEETKGFADELFRIASDRGSEIDAQIQKHTENWRMDRMSAVDRNLLRLGVAEFLGFPKTARAIVINEGLEIARLYSAPESIQFINGVLDSIGKDLEKKAAS
jgi:N utilization substance protein B